MFRIAGHINDLRFGVRASYVLGQFRAAHHRHHHVREQKVDGLAVLAAEFECSHPVGGGEDGKGHVLEHVTNEAAHLFLVLSQENRLSPARRLFGLSVTRGERFPMRTGSREVHREGSPLAEFALERDEAAVLPDDTVDG